MGTQIEHIPFAPANRPYRRGFPLSLLRAQALACCTLNVAAARAFIAQPQKKNGHITRSILWCEHSFLMVKTGAGWRITTAGEQALHLAFVAACEGWRECATCSRIRPPGEFVGKRGQPITYCEQCQNTKAQRS